MTYLLDLPDDIIYIIINYFMSTFEELIRLEIVCRRLRRICISRECMILALETLERCPPFKRIRSSLLDLSISDLRNEIVHTVKLDRSWLSEKGPTIKEELSIPPYGIQGFDDYLILPEIDFILAFRRGNGVYCWSISKREYVWKYPIGNANQGADSLSIISIDKFACDVSDDTSSVLIALLCSCRAKRGERFVQVHRIDALTYNCNLLFESPTIPGLDIITRDEMYIRNSYIAIAEFDWIIILNWRDSTYYHIQGPEVVSALKCAMTQDLLFLIYPKDSYCIASIQYKLLDGSSSLRYGDWPIYMAVDLQNSDVCDVTLLPYDVPARIVRPHYPFQCRVAAEVSTWLKNPSTQLTVTFAKANWPDNGVRITIFTIRFPHDDVLGHDISVKKHKFRVRSRIYLHTTPSVTFRGVVEDMKTDFMSTFNMSPGAGTYDSRSRRLLCPQILPAGMSGIWMDDLGRIIVYQEQASVGVIRFDE